MDSRPLLRLVPTTKIHFHEHPERKRTLKLVEKLKHDCFLRNPPIVGEMPNGDYLLLDGANRVSGFRELEYSHIPVQVVDYQAPHIELKGWHHLLLEGQNLKPEAALSKLGTLEPLPTEEIASQLASRKPLAVWVKNDASVWALFPPQPLGIAERTAALGAVVATYEGRSTLERIKLVDFSELPAVIEEKPYHLCLFPLFYKDELLSLAAEGRMIPTGLTRHLIPGRALHLNVGLEFIIENHSAEAKQAYFAQHLANIELEGRLRFYEESIFIMDE